MILLHNLSGVYEHQDFYYSYPHLLLDEKNLSGVRGYMDGEAKKHLTEEILRYQSSSKLHFLDSGNFHHLSYLYSAQIQEDFGLLVFDHHTDMQGSAFGSVLSCGSWILEALQKEPFLKKVLMIGVYGGYVAECSEKENERVLFVNEIEEGVSFLSDLPIYLSIDKDVLCEEEFLCDWDQGEMQVEELFRQLEVIRENFRILGVDVCGEPSFEMTRFFSLSNDINSRIAKLFEGLL